jgi:putative Holliday junction resolvase
MSGSSEASPELPRFGRLLGLDYGTRRIGVALSTPEQNIASPHENYTLRGERADAAWFRQLAADYRPVGVVVGLPIHMSGEEGAKAAEARDFGAWIAELLQLPVTYYDERFTTAIAEDVLREAGLNRQQRKARLDKLAAQIMLQSFLDRRAQSGSGVEP